MCPWWKLWAIQALPGFSVCSGQLENTNRAVLILKLFSRLRLPSASFSRGIRVHVTPPNRDHPFETCQTALIYVVMGRCKNISHTHTYASLIYYSLWPKSVRSCATESSWAFTRQRMHRRSRQTRRAPFQQCGRVNGAFAYDRDGIISHCPIWKRDGDVWLVVKLSCRRAKRERLLTRCGGGKANLV